MPALPSSLVVLPVQEAPRAGGPWGRGNACCPACGGALWEKNEGGVLQYRCYLGHNYAADNLLADQWDAVEGALWSAVRLLEERAAFFRRLNGDGGRLGDQSVRYAAQADDFELQARVVRTLLALGRTQPAATKAAQAVSRFHASPGSPPAGPCGRGASSSGCIG